MRLDGWVRQFLTAVVAVLVVACGNPQKIAGGTNGTEAGNAFTARLQAMDGTAAVGAQVVIRPAQATDSSGRDQWFRQVADVNGQVSFQIPPGTWTLEARQGSMSLRTDFTSGLKGEFQGVLRPSQHLSGVVLGADSGARLELPGLARAVHLGAGGSFLVADCPFGTTLLSLPNQGRWALPDSLHDSLVLVANGAGKLMPQGVPFLLPPSSIPRRIQAADSSLPSHPLFLDRWGQEIPSATGPDRNGFRPVWLGPSDKGVAVLALGSSTSSSSPFASVPGLSLAWVPDLGNSNLTGSSNGLLLDLAVIPDSNSAEGKFFQVPLGLQLGTLPAGVLPDTGGFSVAIRSRLSSQSIGSLWLFDWTDSVGNGVRVGVGANRLVVRAGSQDTSVEWPNTSAWTTWVCTWDKRALIVWSDGVERMRVEGADIVDRRTWTRREVGLGGGLDLSAMLLWDREVDGKTVSANLVSSSK